MLLIKFRLKINFEQVDSMQVTHMYAIPLAVIVFTLLKESKCCVPIKKSLGEKCYAKVKLIGKLSSGFVAGYTSR